MLDRLTLTLGGNYTWDSKTFAANDCIDRCVLGDQFRRPAICAPSARSCLFQGALAQGVGNALMLGRPASAQEIGAFAAGNMAAFAQIQAGSQAYAAANANNPLANPLAPLRALQFLPAVPGRPQSGGGRQA